ncbi:hypothetical protein RKE30_18770 [Streptomyces sp. Li-HN-5-11]|uniref:hypothetical protein n=1 Tax=Streptomyces sp. Li-HN-5-11 TaxID=3075432 RepID=UPI0028B06D9F|nr:hypothetical protein [Streptomyces sp. Li-HN-5-11]WNM32306.1 hypothetical protein RKE30_18770 [Streptomyces sp. Li-HN-5-11]
MPGTQLTVTIGSGGVSDAQAVVRALEGVFGAPDALPGDARATVHSATFSGDAADAAGAQVGPRGGTRAGGPLSAPVSVTVQGTPEAVRKASDTLARAFTAHDEGAAAGDQEQERQLRLEP